MPERIQLARRFSRRRLLGSTTGAGLIVVLAACSSPPATSTPATAQPQSAAPAQPTAAKPATPETKPATTPQPAATTASGSSQGKVVIRWWDQFQTLAALHKGIWATYSQQHPNVTVQYTEYNPPDQGKALQLAFRSHQMPDVFTLAGLNAPVARLQADGWFQPLEPFVTDAATWKQHFPAGTFLDGIDVFGGKVYSFPLFTFRQHTTFNWFNTVLMKEAGFDPSVGPITQADELKAASAITQKGSGRNFGIVLPIKFNDRMGIHATDLAEVNGAAGPIDWKTGEYAYGSAPFVQALDFLTSFQAKGALFPASSTLDARNARARWATGAAGSFTDGPWNVGYIKLSFKDFLDKVGVGQIPIPDASKPAYTLHSPNNGDFWISKESKHPEVAGQILQLLTTKDYYIGLAEQMDQPPLDLSAVDNANVHPSYKRAIKLFQEIVRLAPEPLVKNPEVAQVLAEMRDIHPNIGEIVQGAFSGQVKDYQSALKQYSDKLSTERERALKVVQGKGAKVSLDDWKFSNWQPGKDYTAEMYQKK